MKKLTLLLSFILTTTFLQAQKYYTKEGFVGFEASVPSFEEVKAKNNSATAILNTENGEFAALVFVNGFRFKNALMEEHFNENYAESSKYPKATFKGNISNFSPEEDKNYSLKGSLTFHGETKEFNNVPVQVTYRDGKYFLKGKFMTKASDFNIDIPSVVKSKIAEDIEVGFSFELEKK
ncbi:YceI family protein [Mesonia sp. K7]|uniref:YceI family protein n=1 Tax=Mesonia sp. K7 TaxID=2218606 RepID=UPI000DA83D14|nr:YceI family protein [Mesonia sp. K7]PZD77894.1 YceI family protein [Mesonia sp. K7]